MSPTAVAAGSGPVTVTIDGSGFVPGSSVRVHGSGRVTTYVSPERLTAIVTAADVAVPGTLNVKAKNPLPGGGASNIVVLTVQ
jgi:hypothetical protein